MKKVLMVLLAMTIAKGAAAQTRGGFELGAELTDYGHRERVEGEEVSKDDGRFFGINVGYTKTFAGTAFFRALLNVDFGSVDFTTDGERVNNVDQTVGHLELQLGRDFRINNMTVSPFIGLASRVLMDESGGKETPSGDLGYDREVRFRYIPIGAAAMFGRLTVSAQYNRIINGNVDSQLSDVDASLPNVTVDLNGGSGYEASAAYNFGRISVGPFVRSWNVKQSKTITVANQFDFFEPANRTREAGVRVGFKF